MAEGCRRILYRRKLGIVRQQTKAMLALRLDSERFIIMARACHRTTHKRYIGIARLRNKILPKLSSISAAFTTAA